METLKFRQLMLTLTEPMGFQKDEIKSTASHVISTVLSTSATFSVFQ